jgi:high-affinity iron transporter
MLPGFLLSIREGFEVTLILGILLGALHRLKRRDMRRVVWAGAISAGLVSVLTALVLYSLGTSLEGTAEQLFEGFTMLLAASVLTWMIFWMYRQGRTIKGELEAGVNRATMRGGQQAIFLIAFLAVLREGIELALFLTAATFATNALLTVSGAAIGLLGAAALGWLLFQTALHLDMRRFFLLTGALLILFAAGLVAQGVHELNEAGWIPVIIENVWNTNPILDESSLAGQMLKVLFGYHGNPSLTEVLAYFTYFAVILFGLLYNRARSLALIDPEKS